MSGYSTFYRPRILNLLGANIPQLDEAGVTGFISVYSISVPVNVQNPVTDYSNTVTPVAVFSDIVAIQVDNVMPFSSFRNTVQTV